MNELQILIYSSDWTVLINEIFERFWSSFFVNAWGCPDYPARFFRLLFLNGRHKQKNQKAFPGRMRAGRPWCTLGLHQFGVILSLSSNPLQINHSIERVRAKQEPLHVWKMRFIGSYANFLTRGFKNKRFNWSLLESWTWMTVWSGTPWKMREKECIWTR